MEEKVLTVNPYALDWLKRQANSWTQYIADLEEKQKLEDTQVQPDREFTFHKGKPRLDIHPPFKSFTELNFPYNLGSKPIRATGYADVNENILNYAAFNIDIFEMINQEQVLPDAAFIRTRYLTLIKQAHPDRGGATARTIDLNVTKGRLDEFYQDTKEQLNLFHTILKIAVEQKTSRFTECSKLCETST